MVAAQLLVQPDLSFATLWQAGVLIVLWSSLVLSGSYLISRLPARSRRVVLAVLLAVVLGGAIGYAQIMVTIPPFPANCDPWVLLMFFICWIW